MLWKCCIQYASKFGKINSGCRTGKDQFSFQSQSKAMPKTVPTTTQLHSSHMLAKYCWKFPKLGFNTMWSENFQMVQAGFRKGRGTRDQIASICWIIKNSINPENSYFCFIDYANVFVWITTNWKILQVMKMPVHLTCLLRSVCMSRSKVILLPCRVHHEKNWAGGSTSWNQGCWEKYQ